ncbi:fmi2 [Trichoderma cornu-damae]|uniref:Fmi2 n=1 Tax=Trichoderma cornu-damae TaxID=654480 RepID=A0A9P8QHN5_9HYPO|nr:fmi2 [Trichoderma cornu-damae]
MDSGANRPVVPAAPFSYRPPSPPTINLSFHNIQNSKFSIKPSYSLVDSSLISSHDFAIITGNRTQNPADHATCWIYEQRREAQAILDFLYLGPTSAIRDHDFLRREAISMVIVVRDARAPINLRSLDAAYAALGISNAYIDVEPNCWVRAFYAIVGHINNHLLAMHRAQAERRDNGCQGVEKTANVSQGKVLVTCESGNDRSPPLVAAYIMSMFGQNTPNALHYTSIQRFCCNFSEESKQALLTWEGIMKASASVASDSHDHAAAQVPFTSMENRATTKRGIGEMMDARGEDMIMLGHDSAADHERFENREGFVPFVELDY